MINNLAASLIKAYSWLAERKTFANTAIPSAVTTYVAAVRSAASTGKTNIANAANVDAVASAVNGVSWPDNSNVTSYQRDFR